MLAPKDNLQMTDFLGISMLEKGDNSFKYLQNYANVNQVMTLAQTVLQIFCSQGPLWVKCLSLNRGIIQPNFNRIL